RRQLPDYTFCLIDDDDDLYFLFGTREENDQRIINFKTPSQKLVHLYTTDASDLNLPSRRLTFFVSARGWRKWQARVRKAYGTFAVHRIARDKLAIEIRG